MTSIFLPQPIPTSSQWHLVDWVDLQRSSDPAADGVATIELEQLADDVMWLVDHAVIQCPGGAGTVLRLYDGAVHPLRVLDGSDAGDFNVADWPAGLRLRPGSSLVAQWTGALDGSVATLALQARLLRRT